MTEDPPDRQFSRWAAETSGRPQAICIHCGKKPSELEEYSADAILDPDEDREDFSPDDYVWTQEGTLNKSNGHFLCTPCYIKVGQPSSATGRWVAP
jgi:hypothetical protein